MTEQPKPSRFPEIFENEKIEQESAWALYRYVVDEVILSANAQRWSYTPEVVEDGVRYIDLSHEDPDPNKKSRRREFEEPLRYAVENPGKWRIEIDFEWDEEIPVFKSIEGNPADIKDFLSKETSHWK